MPITFHGNGVSSDFSGDDSLDSVGLRVTGMIRYVSCCGGVTSGIAPKLIEKNFKQSKAIIHSMTLKERRDPDILNAS